MLPEYTFIPAAHTDELWDHEIALYAPSAYEAEVKILRRSLYR